MNLRRRGWGLAAGLMLLAGMTACGSREDASGNPNIRANEAPPAAPFIINVQNLSDDNNYMKYKELQSAEREHEGHFQAAGLKPILSERLGNAVKELDGIAYADVLIAGDQAYVVIASRNNGDMMAQPGVSTMAAAEAAGNHAVGSMKAAITEKIMKSDVGIRQVYITDQAEYRSKFEAIRQEKGQKRPVDALKLELLQAFSRLADDHVGSHNPLPPGSP